VKEKSVLVMPIFFYGLVNELSVGGEEVNVKPALVMPIFFSMARSTSPS
jgi:hypothetical protein